MKKSIKMFLGTHLGIKNHDPVKASNTGLNRHDFLWERIWESCCGKPVKSGLLRSQQICISGNVPRRNIWIICLKALYTKAYSIFIPSQLPRLRSQQNTRKTAGSTFPVFPYIIYRYGYNYLIYTHPQNIFYGLQNSLQKRRAV
jgi:hypothetical protein